MNLKKNSIILVLGLAAGLGFLGACKKDVKTYNGRGVVEEVQANGKVVILKHEKIEGLMEGMTMGFEVKDPAMTQGLKKGDNVVFSLEVKPDDMKVSAISKQ